MRQFGFITILLVVMACACASGATFLDTFSDASSLANWHDWPGWQSIGSGAVTFTPPTNGSATWTTSNFTSTYGTYTTRFMTTNDIGNFIYFGWFNRGAGPAWGVPSLYMRFDQTLLLNVNDGLGHSRNDALVTPYVTPNVWHTCSIIWRPSSIELIYDGTSCGTWTQFIPSGEMPLMMDCGRYSATPLIFKVDEVSVTPVPVSNMVRTINGVDLDLDIGSGIKLNRVGSNVTSASGSMFAVLIGATKISSEQVTVRQAEMTYTGGGWQIPFNLPTGAGTGWLKFAPGSEAGLVETSLELTNAGSSGTWRIAFPLLEGLSLNGAPQNNVEFFWPMQEGWIGQGQYDLVMNYGSRQWLPLLAAWSRTGPGISIQSRDTSFSTRWFRFYNAAQGSSPTNYHSDSTGVVTSFPITKSGTSLATYSLGFTLGSGQTWQSPVSVVHVYNGSRLFKDPFAAYGRWARATWWTHDPTPTWLRDRFLDFPVHEWSGATGFSQGFHGDGWVTGPESEAFKLAYGGHPFLEWAGWQKHGDVLPNGHYYPHTLGDYRFEDRWGGAAAMAADIARCQAADARVCLYVIGRTAWKQAPVAVHATEWGYMDSPGHINEDWSGTVTADGTTDYWSMCPQAVGWQEFMRDSCRSALQQSGADAVRLDTEAEILLCQNTNHAHAADPLTGLLTYLQTVRSGVDDAGAEKAMMGEFCGSDAAARYFDATLAQGHDPDQYLVSQMFGYGVSPFRFVFPEVKLFDWGNMYGEANYHRGSRRALFNGMGLTFPDIPVAQLIEMNHFGEVMRSVGDVLAGVDCEPLVDTRLTGVVANRFGLNGREVCTLWNQTAAPVSGQLVNIPGTAGRRIVNMLTTRPCVSTRVGSEDVVELSLPVDEVGMIGVFPKLISTTSGVTGCTYSTSDQTLTLQAIDLNTGAVLASGGGTITLPYAEVVGRTAVIKALRDGYLLQDVMDAIPGVEVTTFFDGFDVSPDPYFSGLPTWKTISGSIITLTPTAKGNSCWATTSQKVLYGKYTCKFKTTVDTSNVFQVGFVSSNRTLAAFVRLDQGNLKLTVSDGINADNYALTSPTVTTGEWHTVSIIWRPGSVDLIYDGAWVGQCTHYVPSVEMAMNLDVQRGATNAMTLQIDEISVVDVSAAAVSIVDGKTQQDNTAVGFGSATVSAAFTDYFYVEADDRYQGIRVKKVSHGVTAGKKIDLSGVVKTDIATNERYVDATTIRKTGATGSIRPLGITCRALGGGAFGVLPAGQAGVVGGAGLNNVGLLVRTWGRVGGPVGGPYTLDDGSGSSVALQVISGSLTPGSCIGATGIVSCKKVGDDTKPVLLIKSAATDTTVF